MANNPNFGVRIVSEFESTATYGNSNVVGYVGAANTYGTAGTLTYDLVTFYGDAFTNNNTPPTIGPIPNTNTPDYLPLVLNLTSRATTKRRTQPACRLRGIAQPYYIIPEFHLWRNGRQSHCRDDYTCSRARTAWRPSKSPSPTAPAKIRSVGFI